MSEVSPVLDRLTSVAARGGGTVLTGTGKFGGDRVLTLCLEHAGALRS